MRISENERPTNVQYHNKRGQQRSRAAKTAKSFGNRAAWKDCYAL